MALYIIAVKKLVLQV